MAKIKKSKQKREAAKPFNLMQVDFFANNFDFLRFLAATMVIVGHSFTLYGNSFDPLGYLTQTYSLGPFALFIFFIISGFLITKSWIDKPQVTSYFKKRILRIFPALIMATLLGFFVVGPLASTVNLKDYFHNPLSWDYLRNILFQTRNFIPHVFENNPYSSAVNGSLWSLPVEFWMYIFIFIFGSIGLFTRRKIIIPIIVLVLMLLNWHVLTRPEFTNMPILGISALQFFRLGLFFFIGSLCYLYRSLIIIDRRLAIVVFLLFILSFRTPYADAVLVFVLPYLVLAAAYLPQLKSLRNFGKYGDFSYGMYVYAFPVQQTVIYFLKPKINIFEFFLLSFIVTLILSIASWHFIEKPALRLKNQPIIGPLKKKLKSLFSPKRPYSQP